MENLENVKPQYTDEQMMAIENTGNNILVSAGAGSGKTSVLVERIIHKILYAEQKTNIDELLVVTFTNAAALEMKERILSRIEKELQKNPENSFLQEQVIRINKAQISTIDAFCLKVVKENFKILNIEPNFRVGDTGEINLIKEEALEEFLEEYYNLEQDWFYDLLDAFSAKHDDTSFKEVFFEIYEQAQNSPYPNLWLKEAYNMYNIKNENDYFNSEIFNKILEFSKEVLEVSIKIKNQIMDLLKGNEEQDKALIQFLNEDYIYTKKSKGIEIREERQGEFLQLERAYENIKNDERAKFYTCIKNVKFHRIKSSKNKDISDDIKNLMNTNRDIIQNLQETFFEKDIEDREISDDEKYKNNIILESAKIYEIMKNLCNLIIKFDEYYLNIKKKKSIYTFNDISHFCLEILIDVDTQHLNNIDEYTKNKKQSSIAKDYMNSFKEIIIDEYQDSNLIQEEIFSIISNGYNRFMVGDIKQCVYRFRQANTSIFSEKYIQYKEDAFKGQRIDLNANFRSTKNVIDSINIIFERLMSEGLGEVKYDEYAKLKKITKDIQIPNNINISKKCELYIIDTTDYTESYEEINNNDNQETISIEDLKDMEIEAYFIAEKIQSFIQKENLHIKNGEKYVPLQYKDIVILTRNNQFSSIASKILDSYDIPVFAVNKTNFYEVLEVDIILNILKILDNPLQDLALVSVLYSAIFNFDANDLLEIKLKGKSKYYYDCLMDYLAKEDNYKQCLKDKINYFINKIDSWTSLSKMLSINDLLSYIYKDSNYYNYIGILKNGKIRQANLFSLLEKSINFENNNSNNIFQFVNYIEKLKNNIGKDVKADLDANLFSENENVVRIMTIHKSKGLEFPIVFISNLNKNFNMMDSKKRISFDEHLKLGTSIISYNNLDKKNIFSKRFKIDSIQKKVINEKIKRDTYSEEIRILYVALTRAKEKLILTGCASVKGKNTEDKLQKFENEIKKLENYILMGENFDYPIISPILFTLNRPKYLSWIYSVLKSYPKEENIWDMHILKKEDIFEKNTNILDENLENKKVDFKELLDKDLTKTQNFEYLNTSLKWEYPYESQKLLASNLTVSEIKRGNEYSFEDNIQTENRVSSIEFDEATYNLPKFYTNKEKDVTSLVKGTLYHIIFEHLDLNIKDIKGVELYLDNLEKQGIITSENKNILDKNYILKFLNSSLANRIRNSISVYKEMPFKLGVNPSEIYPKDYQADNDAIVIINGIIDLFFEENGEIVLVDYKTDKQYNPKVIKDRYKLQMEIYKKAIEQSTGKNVKEIIIYLVLSGKEINL